MIRRYSTFCFLAGVDHRDDSPTPPLPIDPADPTKDIYGPDSWPSVDGVVIWDMLVNRNKYRETSAHNPLVLSHEVIIKGDYKLMTSQRGNTRSPSNSFENQWQHPDGTWFSPPDWKQTCGFPIYNFFGGVIQPAVPCLFNIKDDFNETTDLSHELQETAVEMWRELNDTWLSAYTARSPAHLLGPCDQRCAEAKWKSIGGLFAEGPFCGVPGCVPIGDTTTTDGEEPTVQ
jgi:hypothetical protein